MRQVFVGDIMSCVMLANLEVGDPRERWRLVDCGMPRFQPKTRGSQANLGFHACMLAHLEIYKDW